MNRHRIRLFGDAELKLFETSPVEGETNFETLTADWFAQRVRPTTNGSSSGPSEWQFQAAGDDSKTYWPNTTVLTVGDRRWKVTKVERPLPMSPVWKFRAIEQK